MRIGRSAEYKTPRDKRRERQERRRPWSSTDKDEELFANLKPAPVNKSINYVKPNLPLPQNVMEEAKSRYGDSLPSQKKLLAQCIRPRQSVEIVVRPEDRWQESDIRQSVIEDIGPGKRLILAQTVPPILKSQIGLSLELTFLVPISDGVGQRWTRLGYHTQVSELIPDYLVSKKLSEPVIVVPKPKKLATTTLRTVYRVTPPEDLDLRLFLWPDNVQVGIMDISPQGALFSHDPRMRFYQGRPLELLLVSGSVHFVLPSQIIRSERAATFTGWEEGVTCVRFQDMEPAENHKLAGLLHETYRHFLAQRSGTTPYKKD